MSSLVLIDIHAANEQIVNEYFYRINNNNFTETAALFADRGYLKPPFDRIIQGRAAISKYLEKEAKGMRLHPEIITKTDASTQDLTQYQIQGKVETSLFTVNVGWLININNVCEISVVEVKLFEALEELLKLNLNS